MSRKFAVLVGAVLGALLALLCARVGPDMWRDDVQAGLTMLGIIGNAVVLLFAFVDAIARDLVHDQVENLIVEAVAPLRSSYVACSCCTTFRRVVPVDADACRECGGVGLVAHPVAVAVLRGIEKFVEWRRS